MKYEIPDVRDLGPATRAIESGNPATKGSKDMDSQTTISTDGAYEIDE
jgi:hypothetical protein